MNRRNWMISGCAAAALVLLAASAGDARGTIHRTAYLTFSQPVALPGVALPAGTYVFQLAAPGVTTNLVRVISRDGKRIHYMGFTHSVPRPRDVSTHSMVRFGEAPDGMPQPITVWFPPDTADGRQFLYR
jgi:hypothetical protein